jgi:hypothetical protein
MCETVLKWYSQPLDMGPGDLLVLHIGGYMPKPEEKKHRLGLDLFVTDPKTASSELHWAVKYGNPGWQDDVRLALGCPPIKHQLESGVYNSLWVDIWEKALTELGIGWEWVEITEGEHAGNKHLKIKEAA